MQTAKHNILDEETLTLAEARRLVPSRPALSSLWRWCSQGLDGVQLEHVRIGRRIITSREAIARFGERLAERAQRPVEAPPPRPRHARHHRHAQAEAACRDEGL